MQFEVLASKIHRAEVTEANLDYDGSLTIAVDLMEAVGILPYQRILCGNLANGHRFETYVISGKRGSGDIILNGATAHLGKPGDRLTIMAFALVDAERARTWTPTVAVLGRDNRIVKAHPAPAPGARRAAASH